MTRGRCAAMLPALLLVTLSPAPAKSLSPEDVAGIRTISVRNTGNPSHYRFFVGNWIVAAGAPILGAAGGVLVGLDAAASDRGTALDEALATQHLMLGDEMVGAAEAALKDDGYDVAKTGDVADATLVFDIQDVGYVRRVYGLIGPRLIVQAMLTNNQTGKAVYSRLYWYDMHAVGIGKKVLDPDEKYGFENPSDVLTHPETVAAGLRAMIPLMIGDLASALKRPTAP